VLNHMHNIYSYT
ncbi:hypothetical protein CP02DC18_1003B, partial [Chlamydia psittaci 02DC18]